MSPHDAEPPSPPPASPDDGGPPIPAVPPPVPGLARPSLFMRLRSHMVDLTPLRMSRQFRLLWIGQSLSDIGTLGVMWVAIPFQVFAITRSPFAVGLVALFELV